MLNRIIKLLMSRLSTISILIILQVGMLAGMVYFLSDMFLTIYGALQFMSLVVVIWLVSKQDNPNYKLTWVIMILMLPIFGGLFYLLWGNKSLPRSYRNKLQYHAALPAPVSGADPSLLHRLELEDPQLAAQSRYIRDTTGYELWQDTASMFYALGDDSFLDMIDALRSAERFILMEFFIINLGSMWDAILDILVEKARAGVRVMLMYDDLGTITYLPLGYERTLRALGLEVEVFNPYRPHLNMVMNYRDHRKIVVVDGNVGFCGGFNISDEYINRYERFGHWKDTGVRISGGAVWSLTRMFLTLWRFSTDDKSIDFESFRPTENHPTDGMIQPFDDNPIDNISVMKDSYLGMITRATRYLYLTTPYLILDDEMIRALTRTAQCGVDVRIIIPHIPDKWYVHIISRTHYKRLLDGGVRVYEYLPGFIHAKQIVCDDAMAIVGTTNMDFRSFYLNYESGVAFYRSSICARVRDDILSTIEASLEITQQDVASIPFYQRAVAAVIKIFEPLL